MLVYSKKLSISSRGLKPRALSLVLVGALVLPLSMAFSAPICAQENHFVSPFDVLPLPTATQFTVIFDSELDSRTAAQGDPVDAHLKDDLVFDGRLIAPAGSIVLGHIDHYVRSRNMTQAMASGDKRFHKTSIVKLAFDEIITPEQEHIKIEGTLSQQHSVFGDKVERQIVVDKKGVVQKAEETLSDDTMVGAQVVNFTIGTGLSQLGTVATFGVLPVVMGAIGAVNPSIITMKAVTKEDRHPRLRGMTMGVVASLPGGNVVQSMIYRGSELNIKKGDQLMVQAHSPYGDQTTTNEVSAQIASKDKDAAASVQRPVKQYYPKYQPRFVPKAGLRVHGTNTNTDDRFDLWH